MSSHAEEDPYQEDDVEELEGSSSKSKLASGFAKFTAKAKQTGSLVARASVKTSNAIKEKANSMMSKDKSKENVAKEIQIGGPFSAVFGAPLANAYQQTKMRPDADLPAVAEQCLKFLNERGLKEEGIYRIPGSTTKVNQLKHMYNTGQVVNLEAEVADPHAVAGLFKLYLRELPEPLLTRELSAEFNNVAAANVDEDTRNRQLQALLKRLPAPNYALLSHLMRHLSAVATHSEYNKMNVSNLGVVFSPCLDMSALLFKIFLIDLDRIFPDPNAPAAAAGAAPVAAPAPSAVPPPIKPSPAAVAAQRSNSALSLPSTPPPEPVAKPAELSFDDLADQVEDLTLALDEQAPPRPPRPSPAAIKAAQLDTPPPIPSPSPISRTLSNQLSTGSTTRPATPPVVAISEEPAPAAAPAPAPSAAPAPVAADMPAAERLSAPVPTKERPPSVAIDLEKSLMELDDLMKSGDFVIDNDSF